MGTGITDVIGGPHDFLPPRSDRSDEFQKLCNKICCYFDQFICQRLCYVAKCETISRNLEMSSLKIRTTFRVEKHTD
jgi:hypothetical protein